MVSRIAVTGCRLHVHSLGVTQRVAPSSLVQAEAGIRMFAPGAPSVHPGTRRRRRRCTLTGTLVPNSPSGRTPVVGICNRRRRGTALQGPRRGFSDGRSDDLALTGRVAAVGGYADGVARVLRSGALSWAALMPVAQLVAYAASADSFRNGQLIVGLFALHALCWVLTVWRGATVWLPVGTWILICLGAAISVAGPDTSDVAALRIVLNMCLCVGIVAGLLATQTAALALAVTLSTSVAGLLILCDSAGTMWDATDTAGPSRLTVYYSLLIVVYTVCSTLAVSILTTVWREVAQTADTQRHRGRIDQRLTRDLASAELVTRRSRVLHDTVINTLGAVANGSIVSDGHVVSARCRADLCAIEEIEAQRVPTTTAISDLIAYACAMGIDAVVDDEAMLRRLIDRQPPWRRQEIVGLIGESITNAAKHSGAEQVTICVRGQPDQVIVRDLGAGTADVDMLADTLRPRARDAMALIDVESSPSSGTTVTVIVPPLHSVDGRDVLADAIGEIPRRLTRTLSGPGHVMPWR